MKEYKSIVKAYIEKYKLMTSNDRILVALSGGGDSVCLLLMLLELGYQVEAAHCNFHLRGGESMRDEQFVVDLCKLKGVKLHQTDFDTKAYAKKHSVSIEMAARDLRYTYFQQVMAEHKLTVLAVGHHRDDNAETMLLNIVRGTGIQGICGIMPKTDQGVVRPLLCLSHEDVLDYLAQQKQGFMTDSSNMKDDVSRNKIRLDVMPIFKSINHAAANNINTTIENLNEVRKVYEAAIRSDIEKCMTQNGRYLHIDMERLKLSASPISVLYTLGSEKGFNRTQAQEMLIGEQGRMWMSDDWKALMDRGQIIFAPIDDTPNNSISQTMVDISDLAIKKDKRYAYVDADKVVGAIRIRTAQQGDTFQPFGMKGRKLVSDFLTDLKKSRFEKEEQLVACDDDDILWVVGERGSEKYRVDDKTKKVIVLELVHS